jgi:hypothetical protein
MIGAAVTAQVQPAETKEHHQKQIAEESREVARNKVEVDKIVAKIAEVREKLPEFDTVADLEGQLEVARKRLQQAEISNQELNDLKDSASTARVKLKAGQKALSRLLLQFMAKWQQRSVNLDHTAHEIDVTAKVGKELKEQQILPL